MKKKLTLDILKAEAKTFCEAESKFKNKELFGITDGKAVGTYVEHKFQQQLSAKYSVSIGSSANGIDLPSTEIQTDIKVTSIKQPQSSCPFKDAKQIIKTKPKQGYLTISNALQWRLQYQRVVDLKTRVVGITKMI